MQPKEAAQPPAGTQAVGRAIAVLKLLADEESELSLSAIAEGLVAHNR